MKISIVVTTKNRKDTLLRCVESIRKSSFTDYETIIVDDCSYDGTRDLDMRDIGLGRGMIIHSREPQMMVKARNAGARQASGDFVLFIDDDNVIDPDMIRELAAAGDRHPEYGILGPSMYYLDGKVKYLDSQKINFFTSKTTGLIDDSGRELCDSDGIPNVFMVRRDVFEKCGYFDEAMVQTYTEPDFAFSVRRCGFKCGIVTAARTCHDVSRAADRTPRGLGGNYLQKAYCLMRNRSVIVARYAYWPQKVVYGIVFSWVWPLAYSALVFRFRRFDLMRLYWYGFRDGMIYLLTGKLINSLPVLMKP